MRAAVAAGADAVYCGYNDETNARNFPGLNFSRAEMRDAVVHAHAAGAKVLIAINTFPRAGACDLWRCAVDDAVAIGADALILADLGLLDYAARAHPHQRLHLSVQAAASNADAIRFHVGNFGVRRVVLPRVLSIAEIGAITRDAGCETEVFVFGGLCVMTEGRCSLSSYATGQSPNMHGVCSPPDHVSYREEDGVLVSRLGDFTINRFAAGEPAPYPTLCKGRFSTVDGAGYLFEEPASLDAAALLSALREAGVSALKIEGRQRSRAYVTNAVRAFRDALTALDEGRRVDSHAALAPMSEGGRTTSGAYRRSWR